jgi:hypothetical protein
LFVAYLETLQADPSTPAHEGDVLVIDETGDCKEGTKTARKRLNLFATFHGPFGQPAKTNITRIVSGHRGGEECPSP